MSYSNIELKKNNYFEYYEFNNKIIQDRILISKKIIDSFKKIKLNKFKNLNTNYFNNTINKATVKILSCLLKEVFIKLLKEFNYKELKIINFWFQKYDINNFHEMHTHNCEGSDLSFILYLNCTENSGNTLFYFPGYPYINNDKCLSIKPEKGLCLIFPSYMPHLTEINKDNKRFIVSGNLKLIDKV